MFYRSQLGLIKGENPSKLSAVIESAIATQKKIVALEKLFAVLNEVFSEREEKIQAFQILSKENPGLYEEIIHKIGFVYGKLTSQVDGERVARESHLQDIPAEPDMDGMGIPFPINEARKLCLLNQKEVIKKMIDLYRNGHPRLADHFFTHIGK